MALNIAVNNSFNKAGDTESTLVWAIICSVLLHVLLVVVIPNIKFDPIKKPAVLQIELTKPAPPPPAVIPEPPKVEPPKAEPPKPEPVKPKTTPKPVVKPEPVIVPKEPTAPPPSTSPSPATPEVIAAAPKPDAAPTAVVAPPPPPKPTVSAAEINQAHENYGNTLWSAISKFKKYPRIAQTRGWQGETVIELSLDADGKLKSKKVVKSSGYDILDQQGLDMVEKALPFPEPPEALRSGSFTIRVPIPFKLEQS